MTAWCDNTSEILAVKLRTGSAGSNTVADHLEVLTAALNQIPAAGADGRTVDQLKTWPGDMRVIVRRERPHPASATPRTPGSGTCRPSTTH